MRMQELLVETTEEDRAIVSLALALYTKVQPFANGGEQVIGTIDDLVETPLSGVINIIIAVAYNETLKKMAPLDPPEPDERKIFGLWNSAINAIVLNVDELQSNYMKLSIAHELRHAIDDIKSDNKASDDNRYRRPRNPIHRSPDTDPYITYIAEPSEINARFAEVLYSLTPAMRRLAKTGGNNVRDKVVAEFYTNLKKFRIAELFPEKTLSKDYRRLLNRGFDYIDKELAYLAKPVA